MGIGHTVRSTGNRSADFDVETSTFIYLNYMSDMVKHVGRGWGAR